MPSDRAWISSLPPELAPQRQAVSALLDLCETTPCVASFSVGCSLGRGAADRLSDVDAALGVRAPRGPVGSERTRAVLDAVIDLLPTLGTLVGVLRQQTGSDELPVRRVFAQFDDRLQLDLAVVVEEAVRRGDAAPDFVPLYWSDDRPTATNGPSARDVGSEQLQQWSFLGWRALLDADKHLQRGSLWEAHHRLHEARQTIWRLWATAQRATYPWHGLSQVLDHDPGHLPPGIEATVAGLDAGELRRAVGAAVQVLHRAGAAAARACRTRLDPGMADYVRRTVVSDRGGPPGFSGHGSHEREGGA
jgi:hypothetical protein